MIMKQMFWLYKISRVHVRVSSEPLQVFRLFDEGRSWRAVIAAAIQGRRKVLLVTRIMKSIKLKIYFIQLARFGLIS